jgi:predicted nucleic acid-binding protein
VILVDTSVWVEHLRSGSPALGQALHAGHVLTHPFVIGELACGNLRNRREFLALLGRLPSAPAATQAEALDFL